MLRVRAACQLISLGNGSFLLPPEAVGPAVTEVTGASVGVGRSSLPSCKTIRFEVASTLSRVILLNFREDALGLFLSSPHWSFSLCRMFTRKLLYQIGSRFTLFQYVISGCHKEQECFVETYKNPPGQVYSYLLLRISTRGWNKCWTVRL